MESKASQRPSPREEVAELTHSRIMEAVADLLRDGVFEITFEGIARISGVPQRTLFRYYKNKEALFVAFWPWLNRSLEMPPNPRSPAELLDYIPALFAAYEKNEPVVRAMLHHPSGRAVRIGHAQERREKFKVALAPSLEALPDATAEMLLASLTALCSASGWESMKDNWNLDGRSAAASARWAAENLLSAADAGRNRTRG